MYINIFVRNIQICIQSSNHDMSRYVCALSMLFLWYGQNQRTSLNSS